MAAARAGHDFKLFKVAARRAGGRTVTEDRDPPRAGDLTGASHPPAPAPEVPEW